MPKKSHKKLLRKGKRSGKKSQRGGANRSNSKQPLSKMKGGEIILEYHYEEQIMKIACVE